MKKHLRLKYERAKEEYKALLEELDKGHNIYTNFELVEEILSKLKVRNKKIAILFTVEFAIALLYLYDIKPKNIVLYGDSEIKRKVAKHFGFIYTDSESMFEEERNEKMKKFDLVIGNPPYQKENPVSDDRIQPKNHSLWSEFLVKSFEFAKENGNIVLITPDSWMSPTHVGFKTFKEKQLIEANLDCGKYFNEGSTFTYWIAENREIYKDSLLSNIKFNFNEFDYIPRDPKRSLAIHKKVITIDLPKLEMHGDTTCHSSKKHIVKKEQSAEFKYPHFHTNPQMRYANIKSKYFDNIKLYWTGSGAYVPRKNYGDMGQTECSGCILAENEFELDCYYSMMNSKLYRFIIESGKWSGFINAKVIGALPKLEMKIWTDEEIYEFFNITETEQKYILENTKVSSKYE